MKIKIETAINSSPDKAWDYYTTPDHITQWNFATDTWCCPWAENDMRLGGKYRARMEARDGSFGFDFEAVYDAIEPKKHFSYTMPDNRNVVVKFAQHENDTLVSIEFDAENENPIEMQRDGWQAILNNFKKYVEGN